MRGGGGAGVFCFCFYAWGGGGVLRGGGTRASEFFYKESKSKNLFLLRIQIENKKYRVFGGGGERWGKGSGGDVGGGGRGGEAGS